MKEKLLAVWNWLVYSSANSENIALTIKGLGSVAAVQAVFNVILPALGVHWDLNLSDLFSSASALVYNVLNLVSTLVLIVGFGRKFVNTIVGK